MWSRFDVRISAGSLPKVGLGLNSNSFHNKSLGRVGM